MPTAFAETLETIRAEEADTRRLFGGDGTRVRGRSADPAYMGQLTEAANLIADVLDGRRPAYHLQEALTTSDFPLLFGDILDRQLLAAYREIPEVYRAYAKVGTVPDFRLVSRHAVDGAEGPLEAVAEQAPYPAATLEEARDQFRVGKYGRRLPLSWEAMVNDDLDAFRALPERLARGARRSVQRFVTGLYVDANGPHASLYTAPFANIVTGNPVLSLTALQTAFTVLAAQRDEDGEPIFIDMATLVVPPALEITARNILESLTVEFTNNGGDANQRIIANNWMRNRVKLVVDPYIPIVASTANGNTSWYLFADPSDGRPALEVAFLRGHAEPALFMKRSDAQRIGGTAGPDGDLADFDTDTVQYKVRHVFGGTRLTGTGGAKATVASQGDGN